MPDPLMPPTQQDPAAPQVDTSGVVRLNVNMNAETADALRELAAASSTSVTEIVRRAVSVYKYVASEKSNGRVVLTTDPARNDVKEIVLL